MKKYLLFLIILTSISFFSDAQFSKYLIRFKDKNGTPFSINNPSQFLSERSIQRRTRQNLPVDETDLPITPAYIDSVINVGNVIVLNRSKWLNQICIQTTDDNALAKINSFPFVLSASPLRRPLNVTSINRNKFNEQISNTTAQQSLQSINDHYNYGISYPQIHIHEGEFLHNNGFRGEGMLMAIMDVGFYHYQTLTAFDSLRNDNRIAETYDFVNNEVSVDEDGTHGMECLSIIASNRPGELVGSCPNAKFYLYRTEDVSSEYPIEEQNWVAAAERADSIGVDVFSTSLGYTTFDNSIFNHTYADLDGNKTIIAQGCDLAAKKGIISVVAAGNDGDNGWHYISTPADADSALTVGAVTADGTSAAFSSYGPSADGQVKPTVASVGQGTALISPNDQPVTGNGTSFATPNLAGLITCLWQAFPDFTNMEIVEAVKRSCPTYNTPDDRIGYGIPNFHKAFDELTQLRALKNPLGVLGNDWIKVYPNPFKKSFTILLKPQNTGTAYFKLFDAAGKLCAKKEQAIRANQPEIITFEKIQALSKGVYTLKYYDSKTKRSIKLMSQ